MWLKLNRVKSQPFSLAVPVFLVVFLVSWHKRHKAAVSHFFDLDLLPAAGSAKVSVEAEDQPAADRAADPTAPPALKGQGSVQVLNDPGERRERAFMPSIVFMAVISTIGSS